MKSFNASVLPLAPTANELGTSGFPIGCMKWQHAVFLESICELNSIIFSFPAQRTGFLIPFLSSSLLFLTFTWPSFSKSNYLSPFYSIGQFFSKSNNLPAFPRQYYSKSKIPLFFHLPGRKNPSPTPTLHIIIQCPFFY